MFCSRNLKKIPFRCFKKVLFLFTHMIPHQIDNQKPLTKTYINEAMKSTKSKPYKPLNHQLKIYLRS